MGGRGWRCGGVVEQQHQPGPGGEIAFGRVPQAEVADLVETLGQHVLEETTDELVASDAARAPAGRFALRASEGHGILIEREDARVSDGDAEDIAGEIVEHGLLALASGRDVDDPRFAPCALGKNDVRPAAAEHGFELAADELGQGAGGKEKGPAGGMPGAPVGGHPAAGD